MASAVSFMIRRGLGRVPVEQVPSDDGYGYGGGGGMGGSIVTHTEYRDKPLPIIKVSMIDDEKQKYKDIWVTNIKDFDSL